MRDAGGVAGRGDGAGGAVAHQVVAILAATAQELAARITRRLAAHTPWWATAALWIVPPAVAPSPPPYGWPAAVTPHYVNNRARAALRGRGLVAPYSIYGLRNTSGK
ncbi:MAG TPA: hypothetical protein PKH77_22135 [Anaerolineae bacterium]|nr:hypothetical protein [Anaerolineae bacterium]